MKTYITVLNQTMTDIAVQLYGNADAVAELIALNAEALHGYYYNPDDPTGNNGILADWVLQQGVPIIYDETSSLRNERVLARVVKERAIQDNDKVATGLTVVEIPYEIPYAWRTFDGSRIQNTDEIEGSYRDKVATIRLYHDLLGTGYNYGLPNPHYATPDRLDYNLLTLLVMTGNTQASHLVNHYNRFLGGTVGGNDPTDNITDRLSGMYMRNGAWVEGMQQPTYDNAEVGFAISGDGRAAMGGGSENVSESKGLQLYIDGELARFSPGGRLNGEMTYYWEGTGKTPTNGLLQAMSDGDRNMKMWWKGEEIGSGTYGVGAMNGTYPSQQVVLGAVNNVTVPGGLNATYCFAYVSSVLFTESQRKQMANAINYYLYNRGVYKTFRAIL